jgi:hypothetical protein
VLDMVGLGGMDWMEGFCVCERGKLRIG